MSYLNSVRLHFKGKFQAAPSTVNNDPVHFDNATFLPSYQDRQIVSGPPRDGWWNPQGDATWRLINCAVTSAWIGAASPAPKDDMIHSCLVADSDRTVAAKLVDLDPEQQLVSEIWGMQVRISRPDGTNVLRSHYATAAFADIWDRAQGGGGDIGAGAMYQSVLYDLEWGDIGGSVFLRTLRDAAPHGLLSIKFNVDGYNMSFGSPDFTRGRIAGTIGPASLNEPKHFVLGRHFMTTAGPGGNFFAPAGKINFCVAALDEPAGKLLVDLGNALPSQSAGGPMQDLGDLTLAYIGQDASGNPVPVNLGNIPYLQPAWYDQTAGIAEVPADRSLTSAEIAAIQSNSLALLLTPTPADPAQIAISEPADGLYVRADRFVYRMDPGDRRDVSLYATKWGQRYAGARIVSVFDPSQLQSQEFSTVGVPPDVAIPTKAVEFPARVVADNQGMAKLPIHVTDPGDPRLYIDGQVYGVRPMLEETLDYGVNYPFSPWEFVSLLAFSGFTPDHPPTWFGSMQPIFQQYANLYPVMSRFLNLADYDSVSVNVDLLQLAFGLNPEDPNSMPVTRDLSAAKRKAILQWLGHPGHDGRPLKGSPRPESAPRSVAAPLPPKAAPVEMQLARGGKAIAASRRVGLRQSIQLPRKENS
ncbi:MAG TPA: hypothetical protein VIX89_12045 [Bryobacteraceae bacterium]